MFSRDVEQQDHGGNGGLTQGFLAWAAASTPRYRQASPPACTGALCCQAGGMQEGLLSPRGPRLVAGYTSGRSWDFEMLLKKKILSKHGYACNLSSWNFGKEQNHQNG